MLNNNPILKSLINSLWNTLWGGGISNPLSAIEQITYLLFMKRLDEIETKRENDSEKENKKYVSKFSGKYMPDFILNETETEKKSKTKTQRPKSELRWSYFSTIESNEDLLQHVRYNVFQFIKTLNGETSPFTRYMENAVFIIEKPSLLVEAISKIDDIFIEIEKDATEKGHNFQDIQGDVYEMLLSEIAQAGKNGQFRTPRHIIKLMAELVKPKLGDKIADPACGTSGFLLGAYQYILTGLARKKENIDIDKDEDGFEIGSYSSVLDDKTKKIIDESFYGFDIDITCLLYTSDAADE